jgi:hypothetical protein
MKVSQDDERLLLLAFMAWLNDHDQEIFDEHGVGAFRGRVPGYAPGQTRAYRATRAGTRLWL